MKALRQREAADHLGRRASRAAAPRLGSLKTDHMHTLSATFLRRVAFAVAIGAIVPNAIHAQQRNGGGPCELPASYFYFDPARIDGSPGDWTPAVRTAAFHELERIHEIVRASPLLTPLPRYRIRAVFNAGLPGDFPNLALEGDDAPLPSYLVLRFYPPVTWEGACALRKDASSVASVVVVANVPGVIVEDEKSPLLSDAPESFYVEPKIVRRIGGYPQYENGTILITRGGRSPLVHVSQERWLRAVIASFRKAADASEHDIAEARSEHIDVAAIADTNEMVMDSMIVGMERMYESMKTTSPETAAELKKSIDQMRAQRPAARANAEKMRALQPTIDKQRVKGRAVANKQMDSTRTIIRTIEAYLASLTPVQRRADAYYGHKVEYGYTVPSPGPNDRRIVVLDPDCFDRSAPRTTLQMLAIFSSSGAGANIYAQTDADHLAERVARSLDLSRLGALLIR